jgi:hypothetical protein
MEANHLLVLLEIFTMDNVTSLPPPSHPCIIKLDPAQYAFYKHSHIQIHSPEGVCLAKFGDELTQEAEETAFYQLREQICLLEVLFDQITDDVRLPPEAFTGLADMLGRVNDFLQKHPK